MRFNRALRLALVTTLVVVGMLVASSARAQGPQGLGTPPATTFSLTARADHISTPDGNTVLMWGFSTALSGRAQYPGPTLVVNQGMTITVSVTNQLPADVTGARQRVSLVFPGQLGVTAVCAAGPACVQGPLALEASAGGTVTYSFVAARPGTYHYASGTQPELQLDMGLVGALVVRPTGFALGTTASHPQRRAYGSTESVYEQEYLFLLTEMDSRIHDLVEEQGVAAAYASGLLTDYFPNYWFINGRNAPDTMAPPGGIHLPTQPYNTLVRTHPADRVLMRVIGGGHDLHPFHTHGNHARIIARDGNLLQRLPGNAIDLAHDVFTIQSVPGQTVDAIFTWTGKDLGWDMYGDNPIVFLDAGGNAQTKAPQVAPTPYAHSCTPGADGLDAQTREYCLDHTKPIPVVLPEQLSLTFGGYWSGSPFLGTLALLPPGEGGNNPSAGFVHMWHSHTEKEITNFDVFPGGMMTMLVVEPPGEPIVP